MNRQRIKRRFERKRQRAAEIDRISREITAEILMEITWDSQHEFSTVDGKLRSGKILIESPDNFVLEDIDPTNPADLTLVDQARKAMEWKIEHEKSQRRYENLLSRRNRESDPCDCHAG